MAILKVKTAAARQRLRIPVDVDLHAQIESVCADADRAGFVFDVTDICARALSAAVKSARAELDAAAAIHGPVSGPVAGHDHGPDLASVA